MSKHHEKIEMTENAQQSAEQVLEGEVVQENLDEKKEIDRAELDSEGKTLEGDASPVDASESKGKLGATTDWKAKAAKVTRYGAWSLAFAGVLGTLYFTRPNTDWQIEHINSLQTEVSQLHQDNRALEERLNSQSELLDQRIQELVSANLTQPENQSVITKADLNTLQELSQTQITQLQTNLETLSTDVSGQVEAALSRISELKSSAETTMKPSEDQLAALSQLEEKLQGQLAGIGGKLTELFDFKSSQQALPKQLSATAPKLTLPQIQLWAAEINTQWLLKGEAEMATQQLLALEQAIILSKLAESNQLSRLLGQDLAYLEQQRISPQATSELNTLALKEAINALEVSKVVTNQTVSSEKAETAVISASEKLDSQSAFDQLKDKLSNMISFKKREDASQTQVESLLMKDVVIQRALLLVDRIDWALQSQSASQLYAGVNDLQAFIDRNFTTKTAQFSGLLKPFTEVEFVQRKSLAIVSLLTNEKTAN